MKSTTNRNLWSKDEVTLLTTMKRVGHSFEEISTKLGRTQAACTVKYYKLKAKSTSLRVTKDNTKKVNKAIKLLQEKGYKIYKPETLTVWVEVSNINNTDAANKCKTK